jgi:hypothetical protein
MPKRGTKIRNKENNMVTTIQENKEGIIKMMS